MGLEFVRNNGGCRLAGGSPIPDQFDHAPDDDNQSNQVDLDIEYDPDHWIPIPITGQEGWRPEEWSLSPTRFVDGKDLGQVIAWLRSPDGVPVPIRLSQIGGVAMRLVGHDIRREFFQTQRVVSMPVDFYPWDEVESFAAELQNQGFRLLPARVAKAEEINDFQRMRRVTERRSREEMFVLEAAAIAENASTPTIVDGRLEPHSGGFDRASSPVYGVVKRHYQRYLPRDLQFLLFDLKAGQRTPVFSLRPEQRLSTLTWYLKIHDEPGLEPDSGYVRIEISLDWFTQQGLSWDFVNKLSRVVLEYRCRQNSYARVAVSLHPIVRAEDSLGAVLSPENKVYNDFYRLTEI